MTGKYIVIEGGDGCGKDTQLSLLYNWMIDDLSVPTFIVREPYDSPSYGHHIKQMLNDPDPEKNFASIDPWQQAFLMNLARQEIMSQVRQLTDEGHHVLASRTWYSTLAYQGYGAGLDLDDIATLRKMCLAAVDGVSPDLLVLLFIDPKIGLDRITREKDSLESKPLAFHEAVCDGLLTECSKDNWPIIDARPSQAEVQERLRELIMEVL